MVTGGQQLSDEAGRLAALARYRILDTPSEESFEKITTLVRDILETSICAISLVDRDRQWFKSIQGLAAGETPRDVAFCDHTILKREPMVIPDATADPRFASNPLVTGDPGIRSYAGVPLRTPDGYNLGSLCAIDVKPREFSEAQIAILERFAALVVNEMELRTIAHSDFLTGAATRRAFVEAAEKELDRCQRYGRCGSLLMLDIDYFKKVNDAYGHPAGDEVLKAVADCCQRMLRPSDILGRVGGEEFGILLNEIGPRAAVEVGERIRAGISSLRFGWAPELRVTASLGVAALTVGESGESWMGLADAALYRAKRSGRNRVILGRDKLPRAAA